MIRAGEILDFARESGELNIWNLTTKLVLLDALAA